VSGGGACEILQAETAFYSYGECPSLYCKLHRPRLNRAVITKHTCECLRNSTHV